MKTSLPLLKRALIPALLAAAIVAPGLVHAAGGNPPPPPPPHRPTASATATPVPAGTPIANGQVAVTFVGGFEIGPNDYGRPVPLYASMLGVTPDVFRQAFSGVTPSKNGPPTAAEAQANKAALMAVLAPYGVTNDELDTVANYYRFSPQLGQSWPETPASAVANVSKGQVTSFAITSAGSGYSYAPTVVVPGFPGLKVIATVAYTTSFTTNGSISTVTITS